LKDLAKIMENRVKDSIAQASMKLGIDKSEVYYTVGGLGAVLPLVATNPENGEQAFMGFQPMWTLQLGLRSINLGEDPIIGGLPIPGIFPSQPEIQFAIDMLLEQLQQMRDAQNVIPKLEVPK
jgi:hypothetical protein